MAKCSFGSKEGGGDKDGNAYLGGDEGGAAEVNKETKVEGKAKIAWSGIAMVEGGERKNIYLKMGSRT